VAAAHYIKSSLITCLTDKSWFSSLVDANIPKMKVSGTKKLKPVWLTNKKMCTVTRQEKEDFC